MLRTQAFRPIFRSVPLLSTQAPASRSRFTVLQTAQLTSKACAASSKRPQICAALNRVGTTTYTRHQGKYDKPDLKHETDVGKQTLKASPDTVSAQSSIHPIFSEQQTPPSEDKAHTHGSISSDFQTIRETFDLSEVPRQAYVLGLAGVVPYLATSMSTLGLAYEIKAAQENGIGVFMNADTAEQLLHLLEPIQVGYGAVIISFLGAIHWGFEWAGYGGYKGYPRYAIGVLAPAIAWPSLLLPVQYALIAQFFAFNFLYYADSRASRRGWTPPWYGTYRFVLTFVVGATIVLTLIGRGELIGKVGQLPSPAQRVKSLQDSMQANLKAEEEARRLRLIAEGKAQEGSVDSLDEVADKEEEESEDKEGDDKDDGDKKDEDKKDDDKKDDDKKDDDKKDEKK